MPNSTDPRCSCGAPADGTLILSSPALGLVIEPSCMSCGTDALGTARCDVRWTPGITPVVTTRLTYPERVQ